MSTPVARCRVRRRRTTGGLIADLWGLTTAVRVVAALTAGSGLVVPARMYETHSRSGTGR
jgi:hypothetical protein